MKPARRIQAGVWRVASPPSLLFLWCCFTAPAHAACVTKQITTIPLTLWHDKLLLTVALNGSPETMALDTGAATSVISQDAAGRLDIPHDFDHHADVQGAGGADSALFIGQLDSLDVGDAHFTHVVAPIVAMAEADAGNRPLAGLLGADILSRFDVDLDIPGGQLSFWRETGCDTEPPPWNPDAQAVSIDLDEGHHIHLPLKVDGALLNGILDTGAGSFVLTTRAGLRAGVTEDGLENDPAIRGSGVNDRGWSGHLHRFDSVAFGGARFSAVIAALMPSTNVSAYDALIGADALIGVSLLRTMRIWISYRTQSLYVQQSARRVAE